MAWAYRGHYAQPYPGPTNKSMYIDDFIPGDEMDIDKSKELRAFMQEYFIPASNEPSGHAGMSIWRLPRGSNTPMLASLLV